MNGLDWAIIISLLISVYRGFRSGLVQQLFGLGGSILALVVAFRYCSGLGNALASWLNVSENLGNILAFIILVVGISSVMAYLGFRWQETTVSSPVFFIDGVAGALFGGLKTLVIWVLILLLMASLPWDVLKKPLYESDLAGDVLKAAPLFYFLQEEVLPAEVPRIFLTPEGVQVRKVKYEDLDGSTCIACGGRVRYQGKEKQGAFHFPRFQCTSCGRVSDGCLTFEGYHLFYRRCVWESKTVVTGINCEVWPGPAPVYPVLPCPVCGKSRPEGFGILPGTWGY
jgi:uncharacterized membrane protein required for colicin V production